MSEPDPMSRKHDMLSAAGLSGPDTHASLLCIPVEMLLGCITTAQDILLKAADRQLDTAIHETLAMIGTAFRADRAYVFITRDMFSLRNSHEWCAPGIVPFQQNLQHESYSLGEIFWAAFREKGHIHLPDITAMPKGAELREVLMAQQIRSLVAVPLVQNGDITGFAGLDFCRRKRDVTESETRLLQGYASTLSLALSAHQQRATLRIQDRDLRAANDRIAAMIHALPELLVETDRSGLVVAFQQSPDMTLALNPAEIIGRPPEAFVPPHVAQLCRMAMAQVDAQGWSENFGYTLEIDGHSRRFSLYATTRTSGARARKRGYIFVLRDISESYRQDQLNRQLRRVAELSTNLIFLTDAARRITWINPASTERTGVTLEEAIGKRPSEIFRLADSDPGQKTRICQKLDRGEAINAEVHAISKAGLPYWIQLNVQALLGTDRSLQGFMVVANDVTARKLAEARALRDRASAMDALSEGIAIIQPDGRCAYLNPTLRATLGVALERPAETLSWQDISPEPFNRQLVSILPELYAAGTWRGEFILDDAPEAPRHSDISIAVQDDGSILFISRDISARKAAEREQALLREELQIAQSRQLVAQLASGLAHDVANVLAVISNVVASLPPAQTAIPSGALTQITTATSQARALVANLSRLGQRSARPVGLDLRPLLSQAADLARPSLDPGTQLQLDLPESPVEVLADPTNVMQVYLNLILNARDALAPGTKNTIRLALNPEAQCLPMDSVVLGQLRAGWHYAVTEVADTGSGLDPDMVTKIFDAYVTTKGAAGVGLGLNIVAEIVRSAMGAIALETAPGQGTRLQVFWPMMTGHQTSRWPAETRETPLSGQRLLLVDDDDKALLSLSRDLISAGAETASCIDTRDALAALRDGPQDWDCVIANQDMRPVSGQHLAERMQAINAKLPIILIASAKELQNATKSVHHDQVTVLRRPVSINLLVATLLDTRLRGMQKVLTPAEADATPDC